MINRPDYIEALEPFIDKPLVKILAGVRRCGKSTIFEMLKEEFLRRGVSMDHIICKRYTEMDIPESITAKQMYDELTAAMLGKGHCYLLLDEIQEIDGWEKAVNSLLESTDADIYVTGSNSKLMSGEISTYLTGRYVSIPVYTLSFKEYLAFKQDSPLSRRELLEDYIRFGGFPLVALSEYDEQSAYQIVNGIYHTVVSRDIVKRHRINKQDLFDRVVKYIIENTLDSHVDGSEVGPADGLDHFTVEVSVLQRHYGLCHRVVQEVGRSDKLEEYEMLDRNDQGREEIQHDAEPPCMEETDASSYVLPVTLGQVIGDERNGKT